MEQPINNQHNLSEVVKEYHNPLKGFIRKRVKTDEDAEDILQNVFYRLAKVDSMMTPIEHMSGWLYNAARNLIIDWWRKKNNEPFFDYTDDESDTPLAELSDILFEQEPSPETSYLRSVVWLELEKALAELPDEQRKAFEMTELQGMSFKEIAKETGETVNTLISRKRYAVLHLRRRLADLYTELITY